MCKIFNLDNFFYMKKYEEILLNLNISGYKK